MGKNIKLHSAYIAGVSLCFMIFWPIQALLQNSTDVTSSIDLEISVFIFLRTNAKILLLLFVSVC